MQLAIATNDNGQVELPLPHPYCDEELRASQDAAALVAGQVHRIGTTLSGRGVYSACNCKTACNLQALGYRFDDWQCRRTDGRNAWARGWA